MNLLIVAATEYEIQPLLRHKFAAKNIVTTLVTGVGVIATTYAVTKALIDRKYDLVIQAGVAGSFEQNRTLGDTVFVTSDQYGDLGAEDHEQYLDIFEMGLLAENAAPHIQGRLLNPLSALTQTIHLQQVSGLTVNTVSGSERTIELRQKKYRCAIESMEGAAFHYVCLQQQVAFAQIRSISNYVMPRDKSTWRMKDAIINLNNWLIDFIDKV